MTLLQTRDDTLRELLSANKLVICVGPKIAPDLPDWDDFITRFITFTESIQPLLAREDRFTPDVRRAQKNEDKARVLTELRERLLTLDRSRFYNLRGVFVEWLQTLFRHAEPTELHQTIVSTNYPYILTTNFDKLLERAAQTQGFLKLRLNTYSFDQADKMAHAIIQHNDSLIHVFGDLNSLTLDDLAWREEDFKALQKRYSGFWLALRSILSHYSILFVGYSISDPHLDFLLQDISAYSQSRLSEGPKHYLALTSPDEFQQIPKRWPAQLEPIVEPIHPDEGLSHLLRELQESAPRVGYSESTL